MHRMSHTAWEIHLEGNESLGSCLYRRWGMESYYVLIGISWNCSASGTIVNCCNRSFMAINLYWMIVNMYANVLLPQSDCSVWDLMCIATFSGREQGCCSVTGAWGRWWRGRTVLLQPAAGLLAAWLALLKCFRFGPCWWTVELMEHLISHQRLGVESGLSVVEQPWFSGADTCGSETNAKALHNENANVLWRKRGRKKVNFQ